VVDVSENKQAGNNINREYISYYPEQAGTYQVGISYAGTGQASASLEIFSPDDVLEYYTPKSSVGVPTDARGVIVVGALHNVDACLEPFSSQGPTNNGLSVPSVMGPDAVTTLAYGDIPFYGTSAAQPYVAGTAALLLEQKSELSPTQVLDEIKKNTDKTSVLMQRPSDNVYGHGKLDAKFIILNAAENAGLDTMTEMVKDQSPSPSCEPPTSETYQDSNSADDFDDEIHQIGKNEKAEEDSPAKQQSMTKSELNIPVWIKNNAKWWTQGTTSDDEFLNSLQYMITNDIMSIPDLPESSVSESRAVPSWIKNNAKWWSEGLISDDEFVKGVQYLISNGMIKI